MPGVDARQSAEAPADVVGVLIVDDQPFFRSAAREVVGALPGFHAVAEASSGPEAVAAVGRLHPELVLLDVRMPGMDGIEAARRIKAARPATVVVLISMEDIGGEPPGGRARGARRRGGEQELFPPLRRAPLGRRRPCGPAAPTPWCASRTSARRCCARCGPPTGGDHGREDRGPPPAPDSAGPSTSPRKSSVAFTRLLTSSASARSSLRKIELMCF